MSRARLAAGLVFLGIAAAVASLSGTRVSSSTTSTGRVSASSPPDGVEGLTCEHPYVPTRVGAWREYRWEGTEDSGRVRLTLQRRSADPDGGEVLQWTSDRTPTLVMPRRCGPTGAEEPWLALAGAPEGVALEQTWRVPRRLHDAGEYGGVLHAQLFGLDVSIARHHRVFGRETIRAAGRSHATWRVDVEEQTSRSAPLRSTQWLAEEVGLVRLRLGSGDHAMEITLVDMGDSPP